MFSFLEATCFFKYKKMDGITKKWYNKVRSGNGAGDVPPTPAVVVVDTRITQASDTRITENNNTRILETS